MENRINWKNAIIAGILALPIRTGYDCFACQAGLNPANNRISVKYNKQLSGVFFHH